MRKIVFITGVLILLTIAGTGSLSAQRVLKIGEKEIKLQSPVTLQERERDEILIIRDTIYEKVIVEKRVPQKSYYSKYIDEFYIGLGWAIRTTEQPYLPIFYGNSYDLNIGFKNLYRPVGLWAIGTTVQYSSYSYKLRDAAANDFFRVNVPGIVNKEYFRTSNIGVGVITRLYYSRKNYIEAGAYGDYAFSKRYVVKTHISGRGDKIKYRDGSKFNAFNAGVVGLVNFGTFSVYGKYRLTNFFAPELDLLEPARWSIGLQMTFD